MGQRHLHERRGLQGGGREAQGEDRRQNERSAPAVKDHPINLTAAACLIAAAVVVSAQSQAPTLPLGPNRNAGEAITGAFEGWFYKADGSVSLLVGYFNRNLKQVIDIPVGPNNRIEPGGPDYGQ